MYIAIESFTTKNYDVKRKQLLEDDFTTQDEIQDLLNANYIMVYDDTLEITENGQYEVTEYKFADVDVPIPQVNLQSKNITITQNGEQTVSADTGYDGLSNVSITTNVSGSTTKPQVPDNIKFSGSTLTSFDTFFQNLDFSNVVHYSGIFSNCTITGIDLSNFNKNISSSISNMFSGCYSLADIDLSEFNMSSLTIGSSGNSIINAFFGCTNLSNNSLNSILKMCSTHTSYSTGKKLKTLGLTEAQTNTCQTLSNWSLASSAGWTTGY